MVKRRCKAEQVKGVIPGGVLADVAISQIPASAKGTYILVLYLKQAAVLRVGKLGIMKFEGGWYAYVGSAFGPGGLRARLNHHGRPAANPRWHIDYLKNTAGLQEIWVGMHPTRREHDWAKILFNFHTVSHVVNGFGCSDCHCSAHLFHFEKKPAFAAFEAAVRAQFPNDPLLVLLDGF